MQANTLTKLIYKIYSENLINDDLSQQNAHTAQTKTISTTQTKQIQTLPIIKKAFISHNYPYLSQTK